MNRLLTSPNQRWRALKLLVAGLVVLFFALPSVQAQSGKTVQSVSEASGKTEATKTVGIARVDQTGRIWLAPNQPLQSVYQADVSHLGYKSTTAANGFFQGFASPGVTLNAVDASTLRIQLDHAVPAVKAWTVQDWNNHFEVKASALSTSNK